MFDSLSAFKMSAATPLREKLDLLETIRVTAAGARKDLIRASLKENLLYQSLIRYQDLVVDEEDTLRDIHDEQTTRPKRFRKAALTDAARTEADEDTQVGSTSSYSDSRVQAVSAAASPTASSSSDRSDDVAVAKAAPPARVAVAKACSGCSTILFYE